MPGCHDFTWQPEAGTYWDDLKTPATAINPAGSASPPSEDTVIPGLLFSAAGENIVSMTLQLPHAWCEGTEIEPHLHWTKTTSAAGDVVWRLKYRWSSIGEVMGDWITIEASTPITATPDQNTANQHLLTSFGSIDTTGRQISDMLLFMLSRVGGDVADTYGADARLLEFDVHYQLSEPGSFQQYRKDYP